MTMSPREQLASATMIATHELLLNLERSKSAVESLIMGMQDFTCLMTGEGRVVWGNDCAASTLGCLRDHLYKQRLESLFQPADWQHFQTILKTFDEAGLDAIPQEFQLPIKQGKKVREILWSIRPFRAVSERRGVLLLLMGRDITDVLRERAKRARLESELETAQLVQEAFLPPKELTLESLRISAYYQAAERCSGDWWGHFKLAPHIDLVCIADVTGHGAASALVTAMTQATCLSFASKACEDLKRDQDVKLEALLRQLNVVIYDTFKGEIFMTFFGMLFNSKSGQMRSCNAGHNFPLMVRGETRRRMKEEAQADIQVKSLRWPDVLMVRGNPLGYERQTKFPEHSMRLQNQDRFMLYTDGVIECRNAANKMFGASSLSRSMIKNVHLETRPFLDAVMGEALKHFGSVALADDLTMVVVDFAKRDFRESR